MSKHILALLACLTGCSASPPPPPEPAPPAPAPAPTPSPTASVSAVTPAPDSKQAEARRLGYKDFLTLAGLSARTPTLDAAQVAWGPGKRKGEQIRYENGPSVEVFDSGLMIDIGTFAGPWVEEHLDPNTVGPLSVYRKSCSEAANLLGFTDKVGAYMTCKHYEPNLFLDVTMMCTQGEVTTLVVVWVPFDPKDAVSPLPADHCSY